MNEAIAQFLAAARQCFSSHDSAIAQQVCDTLGNLCGALRTQGFDASTGMAVQDIQKVDASLDIAAQATFECKTSRYPPKQVPACALLPYCARGSRQPVMSQLLACHQLLAWRLPGFGRLPPSLSNQLAVTELIGPDGMYPAGNIRFGVLLQAGDVHYPLHEHAAEELYFVLHGNAGWGDQPMRLQRKAAGEFIHHQPYEPHCISTGSEPMVTLWGWAGQINSASYALDCIQVHDKHECKE